MNKRVLLAFAGLLLCFHETVPAHAELRASPPSFSTAEQRIIEASPVLREGVVHDPWLVRQAFDIAAGRAPMPPTSGGNPDQRISAQGSYDLFELLKQIGGAQGQRR